MTGNRNRYGPALGAAMVAALMVCALFSPAMAGAAEMDTGPQLVLLELERVELAVMVLDGNPGELAIVLALADTAGALNYLYEAELATARALPAEHGRYESAERSALAKRTLAALERRYLARAHPRLLPYPPLRC